jgi:hypothetical protein
MQPALLGVAGAPSDASRRRTAMFSIVIVLIIALAAALLFLALTQRTVRRALRCPVLGTDVEVKVRRCRRATRSKSPRAAR